MTNDEAFLRAIVARPDDDIPRLIFADWLDDHGEAERAEFIRVQCALAKLPAANRQLQARYVYQVGQNFGTTLACSPVTEWELETTEADVKIGDVVDIQCLYPLDSGMLHVTDQVVCDFVGGSFDRNGVSRIFRTRTSDKKDEHRRQRHELTSRELKLTRHTAEWFAISYPVTLRWRRGFVEEVSITYELWREYGDELQLCQPITRVNLTTKPLVEVRRIDTDTSIRLGHAYDDTDLGWYPDPDGGWTYTRARSLVYNILEARWPHVCFNVVRGA